MKPRRFDYVRPDSVDEAVALLAEYGDDARILAGSLMSVTPSASAMALAMQAGVLMQLPSAMPLAPRG